MKFDDLKAAAIDYQSWRATCRGDRPMEALMRVDPQVILEAIRDAQRYTVLEGLSRPNADDEFARIFGLEKDADPSSLTMEEMRVALDAEVVRLSETPTPPVAKPLPVLLDEEMTCVPVCVDFDGTRRIGQLNVRTADLPKTPEFVFALGFRALELNVPPGTVPDKPYAGAYELTDVSIVTDDGYIGFLRQIGKLPKAEAQ